MLVKFIVFLTRYDDSNIGVSSVYKVMTQLATCIIFLFRVL